MKVMCPLCNLEVASLKGLGHHFARGHGIQTEEVAHLVHTVPSCSCGNPGRFLSITRGYSLFCVKCETVKRSEGAKQMHRRIKSDAAKYSQFRSRTSEAMKKQWQQNQTVRVKNMCANADRGTVESDDAEAFIVLNGWTPPWTQKQLSQIFEVA